jgi:hypothetical protein
VPRRFDSLAATPVNDVVTPQLAKPSLTAEQNATSVIKQKPNLANRIHDRFCLPSEAVPRYAQEVGASTLAATGFGNRYYEDVRPNPGNSGRCISIQNLF